MQGLNQIPATRTRLQVDKSVAHWLIKIPSPDTMLCGAFVTLSNKNTQNCSSLLVLLFNLHSLSQMTFPEISHSPSLPFIFVCVCVFFAVSCNTRVYQHKDILNRHALCKSWQNIPLVPLQLLFKHLQPAHWYPPPPPHHLHARSF